MDGHGEFLAHIAEFLPDRASEVAKLVAKPGQPFGRTMEDAGRLAALREHGRDSLQQVRAALPNSYARLDQVLAQLSDGDLALTGHHTRRGEQTLEWFIEEFIVKHLHDHVVQILNVSRQLLRDHLLEGAIDAPHSTGTQPDG